MLKKKIDPTDIDLLMVIEDPIWFIEFMNNTNYGDPNKQNWRKGEPFVLRPYQRELVTDKTKNIVVSGGRAIGKCQPASSRIFTSDGWKTIGFLKRKPYFTVYAITEDNQFVQRRATITKDNRSTMYVVKTESGGEFRGNYNHPVLTPQGYRTISDLMVGDRVAKIIKLPTDHCTKNTFQAHELRLMGYYAYTESIRPRFKAIREELEFYAPKIFCTLAELPLGGTYLNNTLGNFARHPMTFIRPNRHRLDWLFFETVESIKIFLEALFSQHAYLSRRKISLPILNKAWAKDLIQLLLYFGIESSIEEDHVEIHDPDVFWKTFSLVGVEVTTISPKVTFDKINENMRWDTITAIKKHDKVMMYAVHVYKEETYISDGFAMHNSIVLENKLIWEIVNSDIAFSQTHESLLITQNQAQLTPVLDKLISRFLQSPFLKGYVNKINRSLGTLDFTIGAMAHRMYARIGGSNEQSNVIGLHVNKLRMDEAQMVLMPTYHQLNPTLNVWETDHQQLYTGVHNGVRNGVLYFLDRRSGNFKKYRIPSPNNPYFSYDNYIEMIKQCGGEDSDLFLQLVLAQPGSAAFSVINKERMLLVPDEFYSYSFSNIDVAKGRTYKDVLKLPKLPEYSFVAGIDCGFADPTIIQIFGQEKNSWRAFARYSLKRIDFPVQEEIIDWICTYYNINTIGLDIGAGGGGSTIYQSLATREQYKPKKYLKRIIPIDFGELISVADVNGDVFNAPAKTAAGIDLTIGVEQQTIVFSEFDTEGISEIERLAKQKTPSGYDRYFILNHRGSGKADDDHIFASYVAFLVALKKRNIVNIPTQLGKAKVTNVRL